MTQVNKRIPEIEIRIMDVNSAPEIWLNGVRQTGIQTVEVSYETRTLEHSSGHHRYAIGYVGTVDDQPVLRSISAQDIFSAGKEQQ